VREWTSLPTSRVIHRRRLYMRKLHLVAAEQILFGRILSPVPSAISLLKWIALTLID
jgi:hypothetical protein